MTFICKCKIMKEVLLWILLVSSVAGFYHEPPRIYTKLSNKSLFGYSIAYTESHKRLIVSAPNADSIGRIFSINLSTNVITEAFMDIKKNLQVYPNHKFWFGATVKATKNFYMACAPRYRVKVNNKKVFEGLIGICIKSDHNSSTMLQYLDRQQRFEGNCDNTCKTDNLQDTIGWSLDITVNDEILVGGPGMSSGRALIYKSWSSKPQQFKDKVSANYNFGYGVTSGRFFSDAIEYAISTTYGEIGKGQIYFFDSDLKNIYVINDEEIGTMFGAALCAASVVNTQSSLLVGAPVYSDTNRYDVGAVSIYTYDTNGNKKMSLTKTILGMKSGGYFGNAILNLGDMDGDLKDDIAIAAPYEDGGRGRVYIYNGAGLLNDNEPIQTLSAELINSFGFNLARIENYDNNGCSALAIGAPYSNAVLFYRCLTSITVDVEAKFEKTVNIKNISYYEFDSCINVVYPKKPVKIVADIIVSILIDGDYKLSQGQDETYTVSLENKPESSCNTIKVQQIPSTESRNTVNGQPEMQYKVMARLKDYDTNSFDKSKVLLSRHSILSTYGKQVISACDGRPCVPDLHVEFSTSTAKIYSVGSSDSESFSLSVTNKGEPSYMACIQIKVVGVRVIKFPNTCKYENNMNQNEIKCTKIDPLLTRSSWEINGIQMDTKSLTSSDEYIKIYYDMYNHCNNKTDKRQGNAEISLVHDFESISLIAEAEPERKVLYDNHDVASLQLNKSISHVYTMSNIGNTTWVNVKCKIALEDVKHTRLSSIVIMSDDQNKICHLPSTISAGYVICDVGVLRRSQKIVVHVYFDIEPSILKLKERNENVNTTLKLILNDKWKISSAFTVLTVESVAVPLWVIIVASLVGLIILFTVGFILYEMGFLQRKKKAQLKRMKVIRRSRIQSVVHNADTNHDKNALLQDEEHEGNSVQGRKEHESNDEEQETQKKYD